MRDNKLVNNFKIVGKARNKMQHNYGARQPAAMKAINNETRYILHHNYVRVKVPNLLPPLPCRCFLFPKLNSTNALAYATD